MERNLLSPEENLKEIGNFITSLLREAGKVSMKYYGSRELTISKKEELDLVTKADKEVEEFLLNEILLQYPQSVFLAEETAGKDYSIFKDFNNVWVIDPIDGTVNFFRGNSNFAISIALVDKGQTKLGIVYIPTSKEIYRAQKDELGATVNGKLLSVSKVTSLSEATFACDWISYNLKRREDMISWLKKISPKVRQIKSMGSAVADMASLADGKIDIYLNPGIKPWDQAAATFIVEKAGGKVTTLDGGNYDIFCSDLLLTNGLLHDEILQLLGIDTS